MTAATGIEAVVRKFALAIQKAEGWYEGSWSFETNNPGNITDTGRPGQIGTRTNPASGITFPVFDSYESGFNALLWKVRRAFLGQSKIYFPTMTIAEFFDQYSGDFNEAVNVARELGVSVETTLKELVS